jgi:hypothetical protein
LELEILEMVGNGGGLVPPLFLIGNSTIHQRSCTCSRRLQGSYSRRDLSACHASVCLLEKVFLRARPAFACCSCCWKLSCFPFMLPHQGLQIALLYSSTTKTPPFNEFTKSDQETNTSCIRAQGRLNFIKWETIGKFKTIVDCSQKHIF